MKPKVSVIVPVFNTEKYLVECLDTLVNQTLKEIEIICVNDGSTDTSLEILNSFAQKDDRVKVITQENKGQSAARNLGIEMAQGEYVGFLDSDDYAKTDMFEKLFEKAKITDSDFVMCGINIFDETSKINIINDSYFSLNIFPESFDNKVFNIADCENFLFRICVVPWNKVIKKEFLINNEIKFVNNLNYEDNVFSLELFLKAEKISFIRDALVVYRRASETSYTFNNDSKKLDFFKVFDEMRNLLKTNEKYDEYSELFETHRKNTLVYWSNKLKSEDIKRKYNQILNAEKIL